MQFLITLLPFLSVGVILRLSRLIFLHPPFDSFLNFHYQFSSALPFRPLFLLPPFRAFSLGLLLPLLNLLSLTLRVLGFLASILPPFSFMGLI